MRWAGLIFLLLLSNNHSAGQVIVFVTNSSFEDPILENGQSSVSSTIPGWQNDGFATVKNPANGVYSNNGSGDTSLPAPADGLNVVRFNNQGISQTFGNTMAGEYTLQVAAGMPTDGIESQFQFKMELFAGNSVFGSSTITVSQFSAGSFLNFQLNATLTASDPGFGDPLKIRFSWVEGHPFLDNVQLSGPVSPVPEPADYGLICGFGLLTFAVWRKRRVPRIGIE